MLFLLASTDEALGDWVPPKLLAAALLALLGAGITGGGFAVRALIRRLDKLEETVAHASTEIGRLANFATREQVSEGMSNMGNRFDERVSKLREEVARLEVRIARVEERSPRRSKA
jgi:hypothetical protein